MCSKQHIICLFLLFSLFILLTPGVFLRIPKKSDVFVSAIVHGILFVFLVSLLHYLYYHLREGLENPVDIPSIHYPDGTLYYTDVKYAFENYVKGKLDDITVDSITTDGESLVFGILFQNRYNQLHGLISHIDFSPETKNKLFNIALSNETTNTVRDLIADIPLDSTLQINMANKVATEMEVLNAIYRYIAFRQLPDEKRKLLLNEIMKTGPHVIMKYLNAIPNEDVTVTDVNNVQTQKNVRNLMIELVKEFVDQYHNSVESSINKHALDQNFRNYMTEQIVGLVNEYQSVN